MSFFNRSLSLSANNFLNLHFLSCHPISMPRTPHMDQTRAARASDPPHIAYIRRTF